MFKNTSYTTNNLDSVMSDYSRCSYIFFFKKFFFMFKIQTWKSFEDTPVLCLLTRTSSKKWPTDRNSPESMASFSCVKSISSVTSFKKIYNSSYSTKDDRIILEICVHCQSFICQKWNKKKKRWTWRRKKIKKPSYIKEFLC